MLFRLYFVGENILPDTMLGVPLILNDCRAQKEP